ncbi:MAG: CNNM domain-containing protein [Candidatus Omnitrophica bacterium]|nr:CNNM domain-containing protein [Candidatus Omnitrophota bacterium]
MENTLLFIAVVILAFALSFFMSGMEAGVFALNRLRLRQYMRRGDRRAKLLLNYLENPEGFLWTIMIGNTIANFVVVGLVVAGLHYWVGGHSGLFIAAFAGFAYLLYVLGDLLPKLLFQLIPNRLCLFLARPFRFVHLGLAPLVLLISQFSRLLLRWKGGKAFTGRLFGNREELRILMQESGRGFTSEERTMINRVLDFQSARLGQILVPLEKAVTITTGTPMRQVLELCRQRHLTRLPVWQESPGNRTIVGLVSLKPLLYSAVMDPDKRAGEYVKPALYLDAHLRLEEALRRMQRSGQRLAIVLGPDRREVGLVSLQDILKVIFGEVSL